MTRLQASCVVVIIIVATSLSCSSPSSGLVVTDGAQIPVDASNLDAVIPDGSRPTTDGSVDLGDAWSDAGTDARGCGVPATKTEPTCPADCIELLGSRMDLERRCYHAVEVLYCAAFGGPGMIRCLVRRSDGAIYVLPNGIIDGWRACTDAEALDALSVKTPCAEG